MFTQPKFCLGFGPENYQLCFSRFLLKIWRYIWNNIYTHKHTQLYTTLGMCIICIKNCLDFFKPEPNINLFKDKKCVSMFLIRGFMPGLTVSCWTIFSGWHWKVCLFWEETGLEGMGSEGSCGTLGGVEREGICCPNSVFFFLIWENNKYKINKSSLVFLYWQIVHK